MKRILSHHINYVEEILYDTLAVLLTKGNGYYIMIKVPNFMGEGSVLKPLDAFITGYLAQEAFISGCLAQEDE